MVRKSAVLLELRGCYDKSFYKEYNPTSTENMNRIQTHNPSAKFLTITSLPPTGSQNKILCTGCKKIRCLCSHHGMHAKDVVSYSQISELRLWISVIFKQRSNPPTLFCITAWQHLSAMKMRWNLWCMSNVHYTFRLATSLNPGRLC